MAAYAGIDEAEVTEMHWIYWRLWLEEELEFELWQSNAWRRVIPVRLPVSVSYNLPPVGGMR